MKRLFSILLLLAFVLSSFGSCAKRTTIPDEELALIFKDAFLANAYVLDAKIEFDTLQVYQPIFDKYGYSAEDVAYTVGSFSKRKSARLSDVVERAIKLLEGGATAYKLESTILDSIDAIATRAASRRIYYEPLVEYYSLQDTTKLKIVFDSLAPGKYHLSFEYQVDSLDNNRSSYRAMSWVQPEGSTKRMGSSTTHLRKNSSQKFNRTMTFDTLTHNLHFVLAESFEVKRTPHVTFTDVSVVYTPEAEEAVEQYYNNKLNIKIFADDFFHLFSPKDSL